MVSLPTYAVNHEGYLPAAAAASPPEAFFASTGVLESFAPDTGLRLLRGSGFLDDGDLERRSKREARFGSGSV